MIKTSVRLAATTPTLTHVQFLPSFPEAVLTWRVVFSTEQTFQSRHYVRAYEWPQRYLR